MNPIDPRIFLMLSSENAAILSFASKSSALGSAIAGGSLPLGARPPPSRFVATASAVRGRGGIDDAWDTKPDGASTVNSRRFAGLARLTKGEVEPVVATCKVRNGRSFRRA
jgi:hypothetical protein